VFSLLFQIYVFLEIFFKENNDMFGSRVTVTIHAQTTLLNTDRHELFFTYAYTINYYKQP
jgi:hypothetical protein